MIYSLLLSVSLFYLIRKSAWFFRKSCSTLCCFPQNKPLEDNFSKFTACWMLSYKCWQPSKANIMTAKNYQHQWISSDPPSTITKSRQHLKTQLRHRQPSINTTKSDIISPMLHHQKQQVCVQPRQLGCQHGTACICCWVPCCGAVAAGRPVPYWSISPARTVLNCKPAVCCCCDQMMGQTERWINIRLLHTMQAVPISKNYLCTRIA